MPKQLTRETSSDELDSLVVAGFLESGSNLALTSHAAALIAGFGAMVDLDDLSKLLCAVSLLCWLLSCWFSFRVAMDASLFRHLAGGGSDAFQRLDELLSNWGCRPRSKDRTIADRTRGPISLWRMEIGALVL